MMNVTNEQVLEKLKNVIDPNSGVDYVTQKSVKAVTVNGEQVQLDIQLGYPAVHMHQEIQAQLSQALLTLDGIKGVACNISTHIIAHQAQKGIATLPKIKNIIAVASGKGGVGKSTTASNLALALSAQGAKVGILDADIYGPSQAMMMGITDKPRSEDGQTMEPLISHDIQVMSIGLLVDPDSALIWRGPMTKKALEQMLHQTNWKDLDYLVVDMPPGTGDVALTLAQEVPITGGIIVTTPQDIALLDAHRGLKMFEQVEINILGIIENMSIHICSQCGHAEHIFGEGGGQKMAEKDGVDYLGGLPLALSIREQADAGAPTVVSEPDSPIAQAYLGIASKVAAKIALLPKDYSSIMPKVHVQS